VSAVAKAFWSAEDDARVKELIGAGKSFNEVAITLGKTRNAIAGRAQRLGLCNPTPRLHAPKKARLHPLAVNSNTPKSSNAPAPEIPVTDGEFLFDLRINQCRWPVGERNGAQTFCGAECKPGRAWCDGHHLRAYQPRIRK
jgi:hypothetical protein